MSYRHGQYKKRYIFWILKILCNICQEYKSSNIDSIIIGENGCLFSRGGPENCYFIVFCFKFAFINLCSSLKGRSTHRRRRTSHSRTSRTRGFDFVSFDKFMASRTVLSSCLHRRRRLSSARSMWGGDSHGRGCHHTGGEEPHAPEGQGGFGASIKFVLFIVVFSSFAFAGGLDPRSGERIRRGWIHWQSDTLTRLTLHQPWLKASNSECFGFLSWVGGGIRKYPPNLPKPSPKENSKLQFRVGV